MDSPLSGHEEINNYDNRETHTNRNNYENRDRKIYISHQEKG